MRALSRPATQIFILVLYLATDCSTTPLITNDTSTNSYQDVGGNADQNSNLTVRPAAPNFVSCNRFYGGGLKTSMCHKALSNVFPEDNPEELYRFSEIAGLGVKRVPLTFQDDPSKLDPIGLVAS